MSPPDPRSPEIIPHGAGSRLRLRVQAGARRDEIAGVHDGALRIRVRTAPERGRANRAVLDLLARALDVPPSSLALVRGHTHREKSVDTPLSPKALRDRLAAHLDRS